MKKKKERKDKVQVVTSKTSIPGLPFDRRLKDSDNEAKAEREVEPSRGSDSDERSEGEWKMFSLPTNLLCT